MQCEAGLLSVTGTPDEPAKAGISVADIAAGMYAYSGVLTALYERERTGRGGCFEVAMLDALGEWMSQPYYYSVYGGRTSPRTGARHASISPYGPYPAQGGQVFLGIQNEREWVVLCERILGRPDLVTDERFATNPARVAHHDELTVILTEVFAGLGVDQLEASLEAAGIANARMRSPEEFAAHPQLAARDRWRDIDSPHGSLRALLPPVTVPGRTAAMGAVPALGQHSKAIRTEFGLRRAGGITMTTSQASAPAQLPHFSLVIDGQPAEPASGRRYESVDPFSGAPWATAADGGEADVNLAVAAARRALSGPWGQLTGFGRARLMRRLAELIARDADRLAEFETRDTGKLLREMRGQLGSIPEWFYYFAGLADKLEGSTIPADKPNFLVYTRREPAGVVAAIVPWNSPLLLLCWKLAPALAAGCTMVAKPSDYSPASAIALAGLLEEAGFPPGVFNVVSGFGPEVGKALAAHPGVDKIAFTGSTQVGAEVAKAAAGNITGVLLELGGKSAHLVFPDADLDAASNGVVAGVFAATGQTCMAGSRLLVHRSVHDALVDKIVARAEAIKLGDPREAATEMGPLATEPQYQQGALVLRLGGERGRRPGHRRPGRRGSGRLLRPAHRAHQREAEHDRGLRGGVRPGAGGHPVRHRGGGHQPGQRHPLRPGRRGLDQGHPPGAPGGARAAHRHRVDQRLPGGRPGRAVRRVRVQRARPGERHPGGPRVHPDQGHLGRADRRYPRPLHPRLTSRQQCGCAEVSLRRDLAATTRRYRCCW